ncbi:MAG: PAS domain-containing protein [Chloroflexota bacterium]
MAGSSGGEARAQASSLPLAVQHLLTGQAGHLLAALFAHSPDGLAFIDADLFVRAANPVFARYLGKPLTAVVGRPSDGQISGLADATGALLRRVRETGEPHRAEAQPLTLAGQGESGTTYWDSTITPVYDDGGAFGGYLLWCRDVTERVRAQADLLQSWHREQAQREQLQSQQHELYSQNEELQAQQEELHTQNEELLALNTSLLAAQEELQESESRLESVVQNLAEGLIVVDPQGAALRWNRAALDLHGYARQETELDFLATLTHSYEMRDLSGQIAPFEKWPVPRLLRGDEFRDLELVVRDRRRDWQRVFSYCGVLIRDARGAVNMGLLSIRDVTARQRAQFERELLLLDVERRAAELDAIITSIPDAVIIYAPDETLVRQNPAAEALLGFTPEQYRLPLRERLRLVGRETFDGEIIPPHDAPAARALRGEVVVGCRLVLRRGERKIWVSSSAAPILSADGRLLGAVTVLSDITALHKLEQTREEFISLISHDLRQPLTVITGMSQWLQQRLSAPEQKRELAAAQRVSISAKRMAAMIRDLVESAHLEAASLELRREPTDLPHLLAAIVAQVGTREDQARLRLELPESLPSVLADPERLERVIVNLITNAQKYSLPDRPVVLRAEAIDSLVVVSVIDQGVGIPRLDQPRVFERYFRAESSQKADGLGLGLYIARLIVEAHGGRIWLASEPGRGSTFSFSLPVA